MFKPYYHQKATKIPLYGGFLVVIFTNNKSKLSKYNIEVDEIYCHTQSGDYRKQNAVFVVFNFKHSNSKITYGAVAHESLHALNFIYKSRDVGLDVENDEHSAYLIDWISETLHSLINKNGFKLHNKAF